MLNNDTVDPFNIIDTLQSALTMELIIDLTFKATQFYKGYIFIEHKDILTMSTIANLGTRSTQLRRALLY